MCGRFALTTKPEDVMARLGYAKEELFPPRYNISPTQPILTVRDDSKRRKIELMRWGFIPSWVKDPAQFSLLVNARSETIRSKPSFKTAIKHRRCLIPMSGYYEWHRTPSGKQPFLITPADGSLMAVAGLWETWCDPDGGDMDTALLITTPANAQLKQIHHRMPAIIHPEQFDQWLDTGNPRVKEPVSLLRPIEDGFLTALPVSTRVNNAANDDAQLMEPVPYEELRKETAEAERAAKAAKKAATTQLDLF